MRTIYSFILFGLLTASCAEPAKKTVVVKNSGEEDSLDDSQNELPSSSQYDPARLPVEEKVAVEVKIPTTSPLEGTWVTGCYDTGVVGRFTITAVIVAGQSYKQMRRWFTTNKCEVEKLSITWELSSFSIGKIVSANLGNDTVEAKEFDGVTSSQIMVIKRQADLDEILSFPNNLQGPVELNKPIDLSGRTMAGVVYPVNGSKEIGIIKYTDTTFYRSVMSIQSRSNELADNAYAKVQ